MKTFLKSFSRHRTNSANVVDGKLVLSFPSAITPVVWQMDLGKTKASALEVQSNPKASIFTLSLKTPKGESLDIASFKVRDNAVSALMVAAKALENSAGHVHAPYSSDTASNQNKALIPYDGASYGGYYARPRKHFPWVLTVISVTIIFFLIIVWSNLQPTRIGSPQTIGISPQSAQQQNTPPSNEAGIPLSADDFLMNR